MVSIVVWFVYTGTFGNGIQLKNSTGEWWNKSLWDFHWEIERLRHDENADIERLTESADIELPPIWWRALQDQLFFYQQYYCLCFCEIFNGLKWKALTLKITTPYYRASLACSYFLVGIGVSCMDSHHRSKHAAGIWAAALGWSHLRLLPVGQRHGQLRRAGELGKTLACRWKVCGSRRTMLRWTLYNENLHQKVPFSKAHHLGG